MATVSRRSCGNPLRQGNLTALGNFCVIIHTGRGEQAGLLPSGSERTKCVT